MEPEKLLTNRKNGRKLTKRSCVGGKHACPPSPFLHTKTVDDKSIGRIEKRYYIIKNVKKKKNAKHANFYSEKKKNQ